MMVAKKEKMLMHAAQGGSVAAFYRLVCDYDAAILALAIRITASEPEARRLYRRTMLMIYENLAGFRFECAFYTWVYRHVSAVSMDYLKRRTRANSAAIDGTLESLTPHERMVVELKHYQRASLKTIGEMLSTTEEAARNALVRGIQKLGMRFNEHDPVNPR